MLERLSEFVTEIGQTLADNRGGWASGGQWIGTQLKTEADRRAHEILSSNLQKAFPIIPVVSEEDAHSQIASRPERYFLIDPIDGTASYSEGFPGYVTQVALIEGGQPVLAAIRAPAFEQTFLAERGAGASLNGNRLAVAPNSTPPILIDNYPQPRGTAKAIYTALRCGGYVECGGISLKICRVADGTADLFFKDVTVRDWDIAAPHLLLSEAGGKLCGLDSAKIIYGGSYDKPGLIAANCPALADQLISVLRATGPMK